MGKLTGLIERVETETGHYYRSPKTGIQIPGVTTILKVLPKAQLDNWKLRKAVSLALKGDSAWKEMPAEVDTVSWLIEAGDREALAAAKIGTGAHNFAEQYMLGNDPDIEALSTAERHHAECFLHFVRDHQPRPVLVERVVTYIDPKTGVPLYCGTIDLIAELIDEYVWLVDYKASSSQPRPSHALQAAAYRHATHWLDEDGILVPMPSTDKAAVVLLNGGAANKCYRMYRLDAGAIAFRVFNDLREIYNFSKVEDKVILGEV